MSIFSNPQFGIDTSGAFGGVAGSLGNNPFGGPGLNVGGFTGATPGYGGGGGLSNFLSGGGGLGFLTAANSALSGLAQANANQSAQNQLAAASAVFDANFGKDLFASNLDYFRQKEGPAYAAKFSVNDPFYRQQRTMQGLPELAGRYGRFGAFVS